MPVRIYLRQSMDTHKLTASICMDHRLFQSSTPAIISVTLKDQIPGLADSAYVDILVL